METFAHGMSVAHQNRADKRVGADKRDAASSQLKGVVHEDGVSCRWRCRTRSCGCIHYGEFILLNSTGLSL
jgi:hypothetical protein